MRVTRCSPRCPRRAGMYESFYLRAVVPDGAGGGVAALHGAQAPGAQARGSLWCTVFDAAQRTSVHAQADERAAERRPPSGWIAIGDAALGPGQAEGECGGASWSLRIAFARAGAPTPAAGVDVPREAAAHEAEQPGARRHAFEGTLELPGGRTLQAGRLAGDGRAQLGRRARRALDLAARGRVRAGEGRVAGRGARTDQGRGADDAVGRKRGAIARRASATGSAGWRRRGLRVRESARGLRAAGARRAKGLSDRRARARSPGRAPRAGATPTRTGASTRCSTARWQSWSWT